MKVSELTPEQKAELQKRYTDAGLKGPIHLMTVEKVEEKIKNVTKTDEEAKKVDATNDLTFDVDIFNQVIKTNDEGKEYQAQEPKNLKFKATDLIVELGGKIPAGQSFQHPKNSFIIKIEGEQFIMSAELAGKIFEIK